MPTRLLALLTLLIYFPALADKVVLVAGGPGAPPEQKLTTPFGVEFDAKGNLLIVEYASRLLSLSPDGKLSVLCGDGKKGDAGDGGPAAAAKLNAPHAVAVDKAGAILIADTLNHKVRRIDGATGVITTLAGTTKGYAGDGGPADKAQFSGIYSISLNPAKDKLVITDLDNKRVRVMDLTAGVVKLAAGNGQRGVPADGAVATDAPLVDPRAAALDSKGNLYIAERGGHALRVVDPAGKIRTLVAGPKSAKEPSEIRGPKHLWVTPDDDVLVTDTDHHRIVKWLAKEGKLVTVVGPSDPAKWKPGSAGLDGPPDQMQMSQPHGVYLAPDGQMYVSDSYNHRIIKVVR
ncbi:MAG TPA: hypothetical protein VEA69_04555 [Tepidisphaeraceae bacterium]|nr:hypothetical protein [Tepidisphaeraceae bacterium]